MSSASGQGAVGQASHPPGGWSSAPPNRLLQSRSTRHCGVGASPAGWAGGVLVSLEASFRLTKPMLSLWIAGVALTSWVIARQSLGGNGLAFTLLVLLLAAACATFNNVQDRDIDGLSPRTRRRPLPSGEITALHAVAQGVLLITVAVLGIALLTSDWMTPALAVVSAGLYNGLYTPLKRRSLLSIVPGAAAGAMPALLGWVAAGGDLTSPSPWYLSTMLVVWQLPHIWLLHLQLNGEPSCSHLPTMLHRIPAVQLQRLSALGILSFTALVLVMPYFKLIQSQAGKNLLVVLAVAFVAAAIQLALGQAAQRTHRLLFHAWNLTMAAVLTLIVVDLLLLS